MIEKSKIAEKIATILEDDPLFTVIQDTPLEETLYTDSYLTKIVVKKFYSTPEVAHWFDITDAQLRYYIKPFEHYLFDNATMNPTTATVIRLNFPAILRLRMILLLKNEYRMKGLKHLLGMQENGHILKKQIAATTAIAAPNELAEQVEMLQHMLQQILQTGLFHLNQDDETSATKIEVNEDYFIESMQLLTTASTQQMREIQNTIAQITEENKQLQQKMIEMSDKSEKDLAIKMRERQLEKDVICTLHEEAAEQFAKQKKTGIFAKLFRSTQIEMEKERFITAYLAEHLSIRLEKAIEDYHDG